MAVAEASQKLERAEVERLVREVLTQRLRGQITPPPARERHAMTPSGAGGPPHPLVVNVSARHMHVTPADLEVLAENDPIRYREDDEVRIVSSVFGDSAVEIISGSGPIRSATSTMTAYGGGSSRSLSSASAASSFIESAPKMR